MDLSFDGLSTPPAVWAVGMRIFRLGRFIPAWAAGLALLCLNGGAAAGQ